MGLLHDHSRFKHVLAGKSHLAKYPSQALTLSKAMVFPAITILQKLSNHLAILMPNPDDPPEKRERDLDHFKEILPDHWRDLYENRGSLATLSNPEFCGKVCF